MRYWYHKASAVIAFSAEINILADKLLIGIAQQCAGQQMGLTKHLEPVTYPQDLPPLFRESDHTLHDGTKPGNGPATEVIAVGKSSGQHDTILCAEFVQIGVFMPKHNDFLTQIILQGVLHVTITIRTRKNDYSKLHEGISFLNREGTKIPGQQLRRQAK
jgi:hypothetical protein